MSRQNSTARARLVSGRGDVGGIECKAGAQLTIDWNGVALFDESRAHFVFCLMGYVEASAMSFVSYPNTVPLVTVGVDVRSKSIPAIRQFPVNCTNAPPLFNCTNAPPCKPFATVCMLLSSVPRLQRSPSASVSFQMQLQTQHPLCSRPTSKTGEGSLLCSLRTCSLRTFSSSHN